MACAAGTPAPELLEKGVEKSSKGVAQTSFVTAKNRQWPNGPDGEIRTAHWPSYHGAGCPHPAGDWEADSLALLPEGSV